MRRFGKAFKFRHHSLAFFTGKMGPLKCTHSERHSRGGAACVHVCVNGVTRLAPALLSALRAESVEQCRASDGPQKGAIRACSPCLG